MVLILKLPWFQFYASDWLTDPCLSKCHAATRGVWMDLLALMHINGRSGRLSGTVEQLAQATRCQTIVLVEALADLQTTGAAAVTNRNGNVTVVNRRMHREHKEREQTKIRVQRFRGNGSVTPLVTPMYALESESESESEGGNARARASPMNPNHAKVPTCAKVEAPHISERTKKISSAETVKLERENDRAREEIKSIKSRFGEGSKWPQKDRDRVAQLKARIKENNDAIGVLI